MAKNASTNYSSLQEQVQFQQELDYCLARLEEQIQAVNPNSRKAAEMEKALRILSSTKAPFVKKRQVMRNMFGDYREKIKLLEKKNAAAMVKNSFFAPPPKKVTSQYLRHSCSAITDMKKGGNRPGEDFAMSDSLNPTAHCVQITQISTYDCSTGAEVSEDATSSSSAFSKMDVGFSSGCPENSLNVTAAVNASAKSSFKFEPSTNEFRFNFDPSGMQQPAWQDAEEGMEEPSQTDCKNSKDFLMKSTGEEFRLNFDVGKST